MLAQKVMKYSERLAEQQRERERMQDVLLLVQQLVASQETTFKLIIDCLYDMGSINFINKKIKSRSLGRLTKKIASTSKPVFRVIAFYWVKRNCPTLITNWLCGKVTFKERDLSQLDYPREVVGKAIAQYEAEKQALQGPGVAASAASPPTVAIPVPPSTPLTIEAKEVKRLQGQVKLLRTMLIGSILVLGGTTAWIWYDLKPEWSQTEKALESSQTPKSTYKTAGSTISSDPAVASIATSVPMGRVKTGSTWPMAAPDQAGIPKGLI